MIAGESAVASGLSASGISGGLYCAKALRNEPVERISSEVINGPAASVKRVKLPDSLPQSESGLHALVDADFPVARGFAARLPSVVAPSHPPACALEHCLFPQVPCGYRQTFDPEAPCWVVLPHRGLS